MDRAGFGRAWSPAPELTQLPTHQLSPTLRHGRSRPRTPPRQHRRRNEAFVHGLRHERNHWTSAARRPRRPQAGASPRAVRHEDDGPVVDARLSQVRQDRRRGDGQLPSPRRCVHLRHARADGAGLQHALPARERAGQFRLDRRRSAGGDAVHRGAAPVARRRHDGRSRQGDRRLRSQLRRDHRGADGSAGAVSRTCSSTARPASPSAWRPTCRRTISARSSTAASG